MSHFVAPPQLAAIVTATSAHQPCLRQARVSLRSRTITLFLGATAPTSSGRHRRNPERPVRHESLPRKAVVAPLPPPHEELSALQTALMRTNCSPLPEGRTVPPLHRKAYASADCDRQ